MPLLRSMVLGLIIITCNTSFADICDRNPVVIKAILRELKKYHEPCSSISDQDLLNIRHLSLSDTKYWYVTSHELRGLTNLDELILSNELYLKAGAGISIPNLRKLQSTFTIDRSLSWNGKAVFDELAKLEYLTFGLTEWNFDTEALYGQEFIELLNRLASLKSLSIGGMSWANHSKPKGVFLPLCLSNSLEELRIFGHKKYYSSMDLLKWAQATMACPNDKIRRLEISPIFGLENLDTLTGSLQIHELVLNNVDPVSSLQIGGMINLFPNLQKLSLNQHLAGKLSLTHPILKYLEFTFPPLGQVVVHNSPLLEDISFRYGFTETDTFEIDNLPKFKGFFGEDKATPVNIDGIGTLRIKGVNSLRELDLYTDEFTLTRPRIREVEIVGAPNLNKINLRNMGIQKIHLEDMHDLDFVDISRNNLTEYNFADMTVHSELNLSGNKISGIPSSYGKIFSLQAEILNLCSNPLNSDDAWTLSSFYPKTHTFKIKTTIFGETCGDFN